jgi:hypothetical protein
MNLVFLYIQDQFETIKGGTEKQSGALQQPEPEKEHMNILLYHLHRDVTLLVASH